MGNLGIKSKVVLLAVLPVTLIAVWLSYTEISTRFETLDTTLNIRADTIARNLARASEVAIVTGNQQLLDQLSLSTLLEEDILSVDITTHSGIMRSHARQSADTPIPHNSAKIKIGNTSEFPELTFRQPILRDRSRSLATEDTSLLYQSDPLLEPNDIGTVEIEVSTAAIELAKREALFTTILATLIAVMLTIAVGLLIGRAITRPVVELSEAVKRVEKGDHNIDLKSDSAGELKTLQTGFISMANTIKASQQALIQEVERATSELRTTLKTVEKQNAALESARKKERDANQAKSEFLANISHEIRTPMNAVIGFADILKHTELDEQQAEYITTIKKSGEHLVSIINDILDLSRIEAGKLNINPVNFNLRACLEEVIQLLAPQAHENDNELILLIYNDVPNYINADPLRLKQIIINLLHNALKFTHSGSVILRVMDEGDNEESMSLGISVEDTGCGIEKSEINRLFTAYSVSQHNPQRRSGGTGLGLSITHKLVESMNGHISVQSTVNKGTVFHCHIKAQMARREIIEATVDKPLLGKSITLFDDHNVARLATTHMLNRAGASRVSAYDFSSLLQVDGKEKIEPSNIVIASLPREKNYNEKQALAVLSSLHADTRCVLVPGINKPDLRRYRAYGVDIVINRPVREENLIGLLTSHEKKQPMATATSRVESDMPGHALIADDHEVNLRVVSNLLSQKGYQYTLANNGAEAIEKAANQIFDVIFMDIHMPGVDGIDAVKSIRVSGANKTTPIIALTADAISLSLRELKIAGFNDRLIKPINMRDLGYHLERWCKKTATVGQKPSQLTSELRAMLLKELPENLRQLTAYQKNNDSDAIYELAHRLYSASCYCDWPHLKNASRDLEASILNKAEPEKIAAFTQQLSKTINKLVEKRA